MLRNRPIHLKQERATDGKEVLNIVTQDNIRELLVPSHNVNVYPTIWQSNELGRINAAGKIVTKEDRLQRINELEAEKRRQELLCEQRKHLLKDIDKKRAASAKNVGGNGEEDINVQILSRAFVAKQEQVRCTLHSQNANIYISRFVLQTEEVQRANRLILATKCHVIRDAQVAEKNEIKQEMRDEELRLEKMMLDERAKALQLEDVRRDQLRRVNAKHAYEIKNQLREREMAKVMEAERIEEEAKAMAKAQIAITLDMIEKERDRKEQKLRVRTELQKSNELSEFFKGLVFEEQRIADMKAQEFMRIKQEREQQLAHEKKLAAELKQREADRLLVLQTKMLNTKDEQEEMNMRRNQEEKEREFRRKEKEAVLKKKKADQELEVTRRAQLEEIKRTRALNIVREEIAFKNVVTKLKEEEMKANQLEEEKYLKREKYRSGIKYIDSVE